MLITIIFTGHQLEKKAFAYLLHLYLCG